jgi:hypothetical protein
MASLESTSDFILQNDPAGWNAGSSRFVPPASTTDAIDLGSPKPLQSVAPRPNPLSSPKESVWAIVAAIAIGLGLLIGFSVLVVLAITSQQARSARRDRVGRLLLREGEAASCERP